MDIFEARVLGCDYLLIGLTIACGGQCRCQMILHYLICAVLLLYYYIQLAISIVIISLRCKISGQSLLARIRGIPLRIIQ